ncbi:uncharacterized protein JN550_012153 [Neoarthrinium moseri]|uniref:uncharacterized protein n=1 Tax=Neoarthrinium moseri TaxID=1658444 RepID=UPI001FDE9ED7|nr:uncharacterized protein JN550_012153 [Neoarthrinium moseri]KAI1859233.1 hypothetical protein JN550_012153 [Neoarthrinium moseri]
MATADDHSVQILLTSNTPLSCIQTSSAIRRVERLSANIALFRLFRGTPVTINADRTRSDIVLGRDATAASGALALPEFSISYPLVLSAAYLTNTSAAPFHVSCNGETRAVARGQRLDITAELMVHFPVVGNAEPPAVFVVCPRTPDQALAQLSAWHDMPSVWQPALSGAAAEAKADSDDDGDGDADDTEMVEDDEDADGDDESSVDSEVTRARQTRRSKTAQATSRSPCGILGGLLGDSGFRIAGTIEGLGKMDVEIVPIGPGGRRRR